MCSCEIISCGLSLVSGDSIESILIPFFQFFELERFFCDILCFDLLLEIKLTLSFSGVVCVAACATPTKTSTFYKKKKREKKEKYIIN